MPSAVIPSSAVCDLARALRAGQGDSLDQLEDFLGVFDMLNEHVVVTDPHGTVIFANAVAEQITGYRVDEIVGKTPALWGGQMDDAYYQTLWHTIAELKEQYQGEVRNKRKDGTMYDATLRITPILDSKNDVRFYVGVERDTSRAKRLERAQREFITLASHNLKTPLASMRWYSEMLLDGDMGRLSKSQKEYVEEILSSAKRMVLLIHQWLTISRIDLGMYTFHNEALNVHEVVQQVLEEMQQRIDGKHLSVNFQMSASPCILVADRDALHTIVHTLLLNAIKYNREGGSVTVEVTTLPAHHEFFGKTFQDPRVALSVVDTGMGIPSEERGRVFQQFFRASNVEKTQSEGAGLGLFLSHELITSLRGDIWFTSSDEGSTFCVALPTDGVVKDDENEPVNTAHITNS